jgi:hypothetical protein
VVTVTVETGPKKPLQATVQLLSPVRRATWPANVDGAWHQTAQEPPLWKPTQLPSHNPGYVVAAAFQLAPAALAAVAVVLPGAYGGLQS